MQDNSQKAEIINSAIREKSPLILESIFVGTVRELDPAILTEKHLFDPVELDDDGILLTGRFLNKQYKGDQYESVDIGTFISIKKQKNA